MTPSNFPMIMRCFGQEWFSKEISQSKRHPLVEIILVRNNFLNKIDELNVECRKESDKKKKIYIELGRKLFLYWANLANHIEKCLKILQDEKGIKKIIDDKLKNKDQFWPTLCELETATLFKEKFRSELEPSLGKDKPDLRTYLKNRWIYVETRGCFPKLQPGQPRFGKLPGERIGDIILTESKHFKNIPQDTPAILIIYKGTSDIDKIHSAPAALEGSPAYDVNGECFTRIKNEAISLYQKGTRVFSGVVVYERTVQNSSIKLRGNFCPNPYVDKTRVLSESEKKILRNLYK